MQPVATRVVKPIVPVLRHANPVRFLDAIVEGQIDAATITFAEELAIRRWCRERTAFSVTTIKRLYDRGHLKNARRERSEHMTRREVLHDALFTAARKRWPTQSGMSSERRENQRRHRLTQVINHLGRVKQFRRSARGRQFDLPKSNGGTRTVTSFDWVDRARQNVLKSALTPFANLHEAQFMLSRDPVRRGPTAVREALLAALVACDGDSVFLHFDIRDFYGSISHEWLESKLTLDPAIVRKQLHTGCMTFVTTRKTATDRGDHDAIRETDRRGIPQGSVISPLIAEQVMASALRSAVALAGLPLFVWSDNLGVIVPRGRASEIGDLVTAAFAQHGAGPFQLTRSVHPIAEGFKFLGVWYRIRGGVPEVFIPWQVLSAWENAVVYPDLLTGLDDEVEDQLAKMERAITAKLARWRWCQDARDAEERLRALIAARRDLVGRKLSVRFGPPFYPDAASAQ